VTPSWPIKTCLPELKQRFASRREERVEDRSRIASGQRAQLAGQGKDDVEMGDGQQALAARGDPLFLP